MSALSRIVVAGRTVEGALCAAALAKSLPKGTEILRTGTGDEGPPARAIAALPSLARIHGLLGFDPADLLRACEGTFRLGTLYSGFAGEPFIHGFGDWPPATAGVAFHQHWLRLTGEERVPPLTDFHIGARLGAEGRLPPSGQASAPVFGLHLGGVRYTAYLDAAARHYGAVDVGELGTTDGQAANLRGIMLRSGERIEADLYVDCSGPGARLLGKECWETQGEGQATRWRDDPLADNLSLTGISREDGGLRVAVPLATRTVVAEPGGPSGQDLGWNARPWQGRCVAIGQSACRLGAMTTPELRIAEIGIEALLELLPTSDGGSDAGAAEFGRITTEAFRRLQGFERLHAHLSGLDREPSADVARKVGQFRSRGRIVTHDGETFGPADHLSIFAGYGVRPERHDILARHLPRDAARKLLDETRDGIERQLARAPLQREALRAIHGPRKAAGARTQ